MKTLKLFSSVFWSALVPLLLLAIGAPGSAQAQATRAPVSGEIELITLTTPGDVYSGGTIVVGGQVYIVPRNLLIDLPANRLTLQQLFEQAPAACAAAIPPETGLAKSDGCNTSGSGGFATISANRTSNGNVIVGDMLIDKGVEAVTGTVTYIDYDHGYFRLNGAAGSATTGVMVRLNDPLARHTIQTGPGCAGGPNCSPDPRFNLDPDNYTNAFSNGYPLCIPSTVPRAAPAVLGGGSAQAGPTGTGDRLCPSANRVVDVNGNVPDSRVFAPILLGDNVQAEGNFETIGGVRFLSSHTTGVGIALGTKPALGQPDYLTMAEVFVDAMGFQNGRARALFIGFSTGNTDMRIWSRHWDPAANEVHEFPLASTVGCDALGGPGTCTAVGLAGGPGGNIFKMRYDIDFLDPTLIGQKPELYPCAVIRNDPEWALQPPLACSGPGGQNLANNFAILSPTPHEIHVRSRKLTDSLKPGGTPLLSFDVQGADAPNGQYIFPMGINLGGIETPEFVEINLGLLATPWLFSGLPWNLDRRLGPGGCQNPGGCEGAPQPLDPFPFEGLDPRLQEPLLPNVAHNDPLYTASNLTTVRNRILSFVNGTIGNFNGNATVLAWPPVNPAAIPIPVTPQAIPCAAGGGGGFNAPVTANPDSATTLKNVATTINVLLNDTGTYNPGTVVAAVPSAGAAAAQLNGTVIFTPAVDFTGLATFSYTVQDLLGNVSNAATVSVTVSGAAGNNAPIANGDSAATLDVNPVTIAVLANDTDEGVPVVPAGVTVTLLTQPASGAAVLNLDKTITYTPVVGFQGSVTFTYRINDGLIDSNIATVTVVVTRQNVAPLLAVIANQTVASGTPFSVLAVGTDSPGDTLVFSLTTFPAGMTINPTTGLISWAPGGANVGVNNVTVRVTDQGALFAERSFTVTVTADVVRITLAQYRTSTLRLRIDGTTSLPGATITVYGTGNLTGTPLGTVVADAAGAWSFRRTGARTFTVDSQVSARSSGGGTATGFRMSVGP